MDQAMALSLCLHASCESIQAKSYLYTIKDDNAGANEIAPKVESRSGLIGSNDMLCLHLCILQV